MFVVLRTLELLPVNVALLAFIRMPWVRIVARPVLQKGQPWAWVPSPSLNAFAKLASLKLGPWMLALLNPTNHRFVGSFFQSKKTCRRGKPQGFQKNGFSEGTSPVFKQF